MPLPDSVVVKIAFASKQSATSPTWTDVSAWVETVADGGSPVSIRRGRSYELDEIQPGTLSLSLRNDDGRFTPGNASSPYAPNVIPGKRIQVYGTYASNTYMMFDGYIDSIADSYGGTANTKVATIQATDKLKLLARYSSLRSALEQEILKRDPVAYYPLTESGDDATMAGSIAPTSAPPLTIQQKGSNGTLTFGSNAGQGPVDDGGSTVVFTPQDIDNGKYLYSYTGSTDARIGGGDGWSIGLHYRTSTAGRHLFSVYNTGPLSVLVSAEMDGTGKILVRYFDTNLGTTVVTTNGTPGLNDNTTRMLTVTFNGPSGQLRVYEDATLVDNVSVTDYITAGTENNVPRMWVVRLGSQRSITVDGTNLFNGLMAHFYACNQELTPLDIADIYQAGQDGFENTLSGPRAERVVSYAIETPVLNPNTNFETDVSGWTSVGNAGLLQRQDASKPAHTGQWCMKTVPDGVTANPGAQTAQFPCVPGMTYTAECWIYGATTMTAGPRIFWYQTGGTFITSNSNLVSISAGQWTYLNVTATAPSNAGLMRMMVIQSGTPANTAWLYVDDAKLFGKTGNYDPGLSQIGRQILTGKAPLDALREIATAEDGMIFAQADGTLRFYQRSEKWSQPFMFNLDASEISGTVTFTIDEEQVMNDIRVTASDGTQYRFRDNDSIDNHGLFSQEIELPLNDPFTTQERGEALLERYSEPGVRSNAIVVDVLTLPSSGGLLGASIASFLSAELWNRFSIQNMPSGAPASTLDFLIEGIQHDMSRDQWTVTFDVSPNATVSYLKLDDPSYGKLDSNRLGW